MIMLVTDPPRQIADKLWMLGNTAYPIYLFQGQGGGTIFEGGIGALGAVLRDQLRSLGVSGDSVRQLVVTHAHPDHVMAVPAMREMFPQAIVLASETAAKTLAVEKAVAFFSKLDDQLTGALVAKGWVREEDRRPPLKENQIRVDRVLREGNQVEIGDGVSLQTIESPGHSDCSLSFYEPRARILIISDATGFYLPAEDCWWPCYFADYGKYADSIERLAKFDTEVLCLSHNGVIQGADDVASYFRRALAATRDYHQGIVDGVRGGKPVQEIVRALGSAAYEQTRLLPLDFFEKNCKLLVQRSLAHEGITVEG
jgi:glyoxylase-like metal-dependent hydrolase (beta-lactamase superfamily II)